MGRSSRTRGNFSRQINVASLTVAEELERRCLLSSIAQATTDVAGLAVVPGTQLSADSAGTTPGLVGRYIDESLRLLAGDDDWTTLYPTARTRIDPAINFGADGWGNRAAVGLTHGADANWENFSVQWDGYITLTRSNVSLALASDDGARLWIDNGGDGVFDQEVDNGWGTEHGLSTSVTSAPLPAGVHRIRIQYEESQAGNRIFLLWAAPGASVDLFTTAARTTQGLRASFWNGGLLGTYDEDLRPDHVAAGNRIDPAIDFATSTWGNRAAVGITGGSDANWDNFTAQWDGYVKVNVAGMRLFTEGAQHSRMWIDYDGDGLLESDPWEFVDNVTGGAGPATRPLPKGSYRICVQYQSVTGADNFVLRWDDTRLDVVPTANLLTASINGSHGLQGTYYNNSFIGLVEDDWTMSEMMYEASTRTDAKIDFSTASWGDRIDMNIYGGAGSNWDNFAVQWDGVINVPADGTRLYLNTDETSRLWVDLNQDGRVTANEWFSNQWNTTPPIAVTGDTGPGTAALARGQYQIRIQYSEKTGANEAHLLWSHQGATISGMKWEDANGNGRRGTNFFVGEHPDVVFIVDHSGSTWDTYQGDPVGDLNNDGDSDTILDGEIMAFMEANKYLIDEGYGGIARVAIVEFDDYATTLDMDPAQIGSQLSARPSADTDSSGQSDVEQALQMQLTVGGGTDYQPPLEMAIDIFQQWMTEPGNGNVLFISDGAPWSTDNYASLVQQLRSMGVTIHAFGAGARAVPIPLQIIDKDAVVLPSTQELRDVFSGAKIAGSVHYTEPAVPGWTIFLDLNNNGQPDHDEPVTLTDADGNYEFAGLAPGTYTVAELPRQHWEFITPAGGKQLLTVAGGDVATVNFGNRQVPADLAVGDVTVVEGNGGTTTAVFTVTLGWSMQTEVTAHFATAIGSATAADFNAMSGDLVFSPGTTSRTITVPVISDVIDEDDEQFSLTLSNVKNALVSLSTGYCTIVDDDATPDIHVSNPSVVEGSSGIMSILFAVTLSSPSGRGVSIDYATADGSAVGSLVPGQGDYTPTSGTLIFPPNITSKVIAVRINRDTMDEPDEDFTLNFSNPLNGILVDTQGIGTILDDDGGPLASAVSTEVQEGDSGSPGLPVTIQLSEASQQEVRVHVATASGAAHVDEDFLGVDQWLTFAPGQTTATINVPILGDFVPEIDENFRVRIIDTSNARASEQDGIVTIHDNENAAVVQFVSPGYAGVEVDGAAAIALMRTGNLDIAASVRMTSADNSATSPADYNPFDEIVSFAAGETVKIVNVKLAMDALTEAPETVNLALSDAGAGVVIGQTSSSVLTITNSPAPTMKVAAFVPSSLAIADGQSKAISIGSYRLFSRSEPRIFRVYNMGMTVLRFGKLRVPAGFTITDPLVVSLAPGTYDTFAVKLKTNVRGTFKGQISFATNVPGKNPFNFAVAGKVSGAAAAPALAPAPSPAAQYAAVPQHQGKFASRPVAELLA